MPLVSIVIAIYNGATTIARSLDSIALQTFRDFEIVCVNDGSSDDTHMQLTHWQAQHPAIPITIIQNNQNQGLAAALNHGLAASRGSFVARLDADDQWHPEKLAKQIAFVSQHTNYGLVGSWYVNTSLHTKKSVRLPTTDAHIRSRIFSNNPFGHSCILIKKDILDKAGSYDPTIRFGQDYDLWFRVIPLTKVANLPEFLVERSVEESLSRRHSPEQLEQSMRTILKYTRRYNVSIWHYRGALGVALLWRLSQLKHRFLARWS